MKHPSVGAWAFVLASSPDPFPPPPLPQSRLSASIPPLPPFPPPVVFCFCIRSTADTRAARQ